MYIRYQTFSNRGELSLESQQLLQRMKRPLPPWERHVRLMDRREDVFLWNAKCLREMPGKHTNIKVQCILKQYASTKQ